MKYIKTFEDFGEGAYIGAPLTNDIGPGIFTTQGSSNILTAGGSDGFIGGEFYKNSGANSTPYPDKYKQTVKSINKKDSIKRKNAIKKLQKLQRTQSLMSFDEFTKK